MMHQHQTDGLIYSLLTTLILTSSLTVYGQNGSTQTKGDGRPRAGTRFQPHEITTSADNAKEVYAVDMDRDGDIDVLSASVDDNKLAWYENDGHQRFTPHTISTTFVYVRAVSAVDLDSDMDVLSGSGKDDTVAWHENDGSQNFCRPRYLRPRRTSLLIISH